MDDFEKGPVAPSLPIDAAALRQWLVAELLPGRQQWPFQDRLALFAAAIELARELKLVERYLFLWAYGAKDTGRTLKKLAEPISKKSLERAAASRAEILHRKFPGGESEFAEWIIERAERLEAEANGVQEVLPLGDESEAGDVSALGEA